MDLSLIEIIDVFEVTPQSAMCHELALIKLSTEDASHDVIASIVDSHQARLVHRGAASILIEATGPSARLDNLVDQLRPLGIREMVRTGAVAMTLD